MSEVVGLAGEMLEQDTDGTGLRRFLDEAFKWMAADRGLQQIDLTREKRSRHAGIFRGRGHVRCRTYTVRRFVAR
jgi:hypothetical protein